MYSCGYPGFSIEKPILALYNPESLSGKQKSGSYYGELKLKIRRGFLTIDYKHQIDFFRHTINIPEKNMALAFERLENMQLPEKTVFDSGIYIDDNQPRLFIFDILILKGNKLTQTCLQRRKLLETLIKTDELIWRPVFADMWFREFDLMLTGKSTLVKRAALNYGIPYEKLVNNVEGLVVKDKKSQLRYPDKVYFSPSFFKLRMDLVKKYQEK